MFKRSLLFMFLAVVCFSLASTTLAQDAVATVITPDASPSPSPTASPTPTPAKNFIRSIISDEKAIVTSPFHLKSSQLKWVVPAVVGVAAIAATDRMTSRRVSLNGSLPGVSHKISNGGSLYSLGAITGGMYLLGRTNNNDRLRETGRLGAEALIDSELVTKGLKLAFQRSRPNHDNGSGEFFEGGGSFPSGHSSNAWAVATVVALEYKKHKWVSYLAYAAATVISLSRYSGRNHFLSDIVVGSALGYGTGRLVYTAHH